MRPHGGARPRESPDHRGSAPLGTGTVEAVSDLFNIYLYTYLAFIYTHICVYIYTYIQSNTYFEFQDKKQ